MIVDSSPKLFVSEEASLLADLAGIKLDLEFALFCFERFDCNKLFKFSHLGEERTNYALATAGLIHYRRAFNGGQRRFDLRSAMFSACPQCQEISNELYVIANKQIAHSASNYEIIGAPIQVAIDRETQEAHFRGVCGNSVYASLMPEIRRLDSLCHLRFLLSQVVEPEIKRLEHAIGALIAGLSSEDLKALPDGFPPNETNLLKKRNWPPRAEF